MKQTEKPLYDKVIDGDEITAKEFLRTIWFQEPKEYDEEAVTEAMELYAKRQTGLNFKRLAEANKLRDNDFGNELVHNSLEHWALKLVNEIGEYGGAVEKGNRPQDNSTRKDFTVDEQGKELADIVILADLNAQKLGISLEKYIIQKFNAKSDKINSKVKL